MSDPDVGMRRTTPPSMLRLGSLTREERRTMSLAIRPEVLRGSRLSKCLRGFGHHWHTSPVDLPPCRKLALWDQSELCPRIDIFISQTWRTPGWQKYLSLMIQLYYWKAAAVYVCSLALFCALDFMDWLPHVNGGKVNTSEHVIHLRVSSWCCIPSLLSLGALFLYPEICPSRHDPLVFFDALCINQVDDQLKTEGIYSLGGFVANSDKLLVLWSPEYLMRCWCVYEIAMFVAVHGPDAVIWCPMFMNCWQFFGLIASLVGVGLHSVFVFVELERNFRSAVVVGLALIPITICVHLARTYMYDKERLLAQLADFKLSHAQCREERDRSLINKSVIHWFGDIEDFENFVRGPLRHNVLPVVQRFGMSYRSSVEMASPLISLCLQWSLAWIGSGLPVEAAVVQMTGIFVIPFCWVPLLYMLFLGTCDYIKKPLSSAAADVALEVLVATVMAAIVAALVATRVALSGSDVCGAPVYAAHVVATICVFQRRPGMCSRRGAACRPREGRDVGAVEMQHLS